MGLHLCYDLAAPEASDARDILERVRRYATSLPFAEVADLTSGRDGRQSWFAAAWYLPVDEDGRLRPREWEPADGQPPSMVGVEPIEWLAFRIKPGRGCETAEIGLARHPETWLVDGEAQATRLDRTWRWHHCCKTQYASTVSHEHFRRCHGSLVSLLDHAAEVGMVAEVRDQTGFWDHRDWEAAIHEVEAMNGVVAGLASAFADQLEDPALRVATPVADHPDYPGVAGSGRWRRTFSKLLQSIPLRLPPDR